MQQPNYAFSPSLLDAFQRMVDTKVEEFFYQDETGAWHLNWNEAEETLHYSEEEEGASLKVGKNCGEIPSIQGFWRFSVPA